MTTLRPHLPTTTTGSSRARVDETRDPRDTLPRECVDSSFSRVRVVVQSGEWEICPPLQPVPRVPRRLSVYEVNAVRVPARVAGVWGAVVDVLAVQHHHRAGLDLQRRELREVPARVLALEGDAVPPRRVDHHLLRYPVRVRAPQRPQATVADGAVLERDPYPGAGHRVRPEERGVLVRRDLAADARVLEDVHALHRRGLGHAQGPQELAHLRGPRERAERRVDVVHGVSDLVDGLGLRLSQFPGALVEGVLLEEEGEVVAAVQEVRVAGALLVLRREDGSRDGGWVEGFHELVRAAEHARDLVG
mmetsp:Transcript_1185/g.4631  ORF Transcript_1185/g.4631 Transcript_1185/m.4631 type:complete len:305 (+) Transcript_1185:45-959(+)